MRSSNFLKFFIVLVATTTHVNSQTQTPCTPGGTECDVLDCHICDGTNCVDDCDAACTTGCDATCACNPVPCPVGTECDAHTCRSCDGINCVDDCAACPTDCDSTVSPCVCNTTPECTNDADCSTQGPCFTCEGSVCVNPCATCPDNCVDTSPPCQCKECEHFSECPQCQKCDFRICVTCGEFCDTNNCDSTTCNCGSPSQGCSSDVDCLECETCSGGTCVARCLSCPNSCIDNCRCGTSGGGCQFDIDCPQCQHCDLTVGVCQDNCLVCPNQCHDGCKCGNNARAAAVAGGSLCLTVAGLLWT